MLFHSFYCDNIDARIVALHKEACNLVGLSVQYHTMPIAQLEQDGISAHCAHGQWMEQLFDKQEEDLIGFIDIDCIVLCPSIVDLVEAEVDKNDTAVGVAQCANHLPSRNIPYAAPAFMVAKRSLWDRLGRPGLAANAEMDTAQSITMACLASDMEIGLLMPEGHSPEGPSWPLANAGSFGIGTMYGGGKIFHLFQSSKGPSYLHLLEEQVHKLRIR